MLQIEKDAVLAIKELGIFRCIHSELPFNHSMVDATEERKVWCFDRVDNMIDSSWGTEKSFYRNALRMESPREVGICWMEIASQAEKIAKA